MQAKGKETLLYHSGLKLAGNSLVSRQSALEPAFLLPKTGNPAAEVRLYLLLEQKTGMTATHSVVS